MNQSPILYRLQNIDIQIDKIEQRIGDIKELKNADITVEQAEEKKHAIEQKQKEASRTLSKIENDLESIRIKLNTNEASLYKGNIRNPKELQDLQIENESLKKRIELMENDQLDAMLLLEKVDQELNDASKKLVQAQADLVSKQAIWSGEETLLKSKKETLQMERAALVGSIIPENLKLYEKLRAQKRGIAVARIEDNTCGACGSEIRPAELQTARLPQQLAFCSACGRILYSG